jgi:hypothetical protein
LLEQIAARQPDAGSKCIQPQLRGVDDQNMTPEDRWDCTVKMVRTLAPPTCPGLLPQSFQTPLQALAAWKAQDQASQGAKGRAGGAGGTGDQSIASSLFEQSAEQASKVANDPNAAARLDAAAKAREAEVNQLASNGLQRQAAILGSMANNVVSSIQAGTFKETYGSSDGGVIGSTTRTLQQYAAADGGFTAITRPTPAPGLAIAPAAPDPVAAAGGTGSQSCVQGQAELDKEFDAMAARQPSSPSVVEQLQQTMYMIQLATAQLNSAACANDPNAKGKLAAYKQTFDSVMRTCKQTASNLAACNPQRNW